MKKTLYLSIDETLYKWLKKTAKEGKRSASAQVETFLLTIKKGVK